LFSLRGKKNVLFENWSLYLSLFLPIFKIGIFLKEENCF
jgi:hypothetical protein